MIGHTDAMMGEGIGNWTMMSVLAVVLLVAVIDMLSRK